MEPVSIPDVLAERPVLVFGKWRGNPEGKIKLSGITGGGNYSETLKVADYRPSRDNAALKYLWARHRITILSDYNKLRSDDKRINEVTELGLTYNLLTAYTSFVAVDTEVRNTNGKPTTVKQPLPLPEGVSDYAVGGHGNYAAAPAMYKSMGTRYKMESSLSEDKLTAREMKTPGKKDKGQSVRVVRAAVDAGLSRNDVLKVAQAKGNEIEKCLAGANWSGELKIHVTINADGTVQKAEIASGDLNDAARIRCIVDCVGKWIFPAPANGQAVKATITFRM